MITSKDSKRQKVKPDCYQKVINISIYLSVQEAPKHHHRTSPSPMFNLQDRGDYSSGQGCCQKERGGREDGEADARGEEGQLDGELGRARVSKERKMSHIDLIHIFQDILPYLSNP